MVTVFRSGGDNLTRLRWDFDVCASGGTVGLRLYFYGIERRKTERGRFSGAKPQDRWQSIDERSYTSGLDRPQGIPSDVIEEAKRGVAFDVYIGFRNEACLFVVAA